MPAKNSTKRGQVEVLITRGKNGTPLSEPEEPENKEDEQASDASEPNQGKVKAEPKKRGRKKKDTKAEGTRKGSARNLEGSGHAYASPCERCYLKELFCERPKSGQGNCVPCKLNKLHCEYRQSSQQIGAMTRKAFNDKRQGLNLRSKRSASAGPSKQPGGEEEAAEHEEEDENAGRRFLFHDVDEIMRSVANLADSEIQISKELKQRMAKLETHVSERIGGIERALTALCTLVNTAARDHGEPHLICPVSLTNLYHSPGSTVQR